MWPPRKGRHLKLESLLTWAASLTYLVIQLYVSGKRRRRPLLVHQDRKEAYEGSRRGDQYQNWCFENSIGPGSESNRDSLYKMWKK